MRSDTKLALATALNGCLWTAEQAEGDEIKTLVLATVEDAFQYEAKQMASYSKESVLADVDAQSPAAIREELGRMRFAKRLGSPGGYELGDEAWQHYIAAASS